MRCVISPVPGPVLAGTFRSKNPTLGVSFQGDFVEKQRKYNKLYFSVDDTSKNISIEVNICTVMHIDFMENDADASLVP